MTNASTSLQPGEPPPDPEDPRPDRRPPRRDRSRRRTRSFTAQVLRDTLRRWGARLGLVWVLVLLVCAVFAPLLAGSHPIVMRTADGWASPAWRHADWADLTLLASPLLLAIAWAVFPTGRARALAFILALLAVAIPASILKTPPRVTVYETYRQMQDQGQIQWALMPPIPFSPSDYLRDQPGARLRAPSPTHPMGTTADGADLASNMIHAARIALSIGFISTGIAVAIGVLVGGLMGYFSGLVDLIGMRLVEIFSAIPTLLLLLIFVAAFEVNLYLMMVIIGLTSWVGYAHFIRAEFLKLRQQDFVAAARAAGLPLFSILFKHMLPNGVAPVLVSASFGVAGAILAESTLSFLGIGLVTDASWGKLLNQALGVGGSFYWWIALYPGLAIFLTVFAYNLVGEALRDAIDPYIT